MLSFNARIETLLRMQKHIDNTHKLLDFLKSHEQGSMGKDLDLESHQIMKLQREYFLKVQGQ